ncbi:MAG: pyridoxamine 5'-phosphate oxidase family protein [Acidimicrobiales bacterium]
MVVIDGRTWLEYLSASACWEALSTVEVGRLGVLVNSAPEIYPVNFVVDDHTIVFRAGSGGKVLGLGRSPSVCFQVDGIDVDQQTGWSVLVKGRATEQVTADDLRQVLSLPLRSWAVGVKDHWIRIRPDQVTGRRIQTL